MAKEIWETTFFSKKYQVSTLGRIKSFHRKKEKILSETRGNGEYYMASLLDNGRRLQISVHRLVALTFLSNFENKKIVNHINGNKLDNRLENLEWTTQKENLNYYWAKNHSDKCCVCKGYKLHLERLKMWGNKPI